MSLLEDAEDWPEIGKHIAARLDALFEGQARIEELVKLKTKLAASGRGPLEHPQGRSRPSVRARVSRVSHFQQDLDFAQDSMTVKEVVEIKTTTLESDGADQVPDVSVKRRFAVANRNSCVGWALPSDWPTNLKMHAFKTRGSPATVEQVAARLEGHIEDLAVSHKVSIEEIVHIDPQQLRLKVNGWFRALHPYSAVRACWDQFSCLVLGYELMLLPVVLAWNMQFTGFQLSLASATFTFWLADMVLNFFTGFVRNGEVTLTFTASASAYLKGWFALDFGILLCNGFSLFFADAGRDNDATSTTLLRIGKVVRVLRVISVMRMLRISEAVKRIIDTSGGAEMSSLTEIPALMFVMCFVSHVFACCWFALSVYGSSDTGRAWVTSSLPGTDMHYTEVPMAHQYTTAYHWALSQMTSGAMGLQAENTSERAFNIVVLIVGVVLSSTIISRLTAKLAEYSSLKSKQRHTVNTLSNYLRKVGVDHKLVIATSLQVRERMQSLEESSFDPTLALEILPLTMQALLYYEIGRMNLCQPVFRMWSIIDGETVVSMSFKQFVSFQIFGKGDTVFQAASHAEAAYVVVMGLLRYTQAPETSLVPVAVSVDVANHAFLAEAVLYCDWIHVGTAEVQQTTDVLIVDPELFKQEIEKSVVMSWVSKEFAKVYHTKIATKVSTDDFEGHPTDLTIPHASPEDIFPSLPRDVLNIFGLCAIHTMMTTAKPYRTHSLRKYCGELQKEVKDGKCVVLLHADGSVERVATVVTLKLCRDDGRFLVHLASVQKSGVCRVKVELPGCKAISGETREKTVQRTMRSWLRPLAQIITTGTIPYQSTGKVSKRSEYPLRLTYVLTCLEFAVCGAGVTSDRVVSVSSQGPLCSDLAIQSALLLARRSPGEAEDDYSVWAWLSEEELAQLQADDVSSKLSAALEEYHMQHSDFERASKCFFNGSCDSDETHDGQVHVEHSDHVLGIASLPDASDLALDQEPPWTPATRDVMQRLSGTQ